MEPIEQHSFDIDEVVARFAEKRATYEQFSHVLATLIRSLLDAKQLQYELVSSRTKTTDSFKEKLSRKGKAYTNPLDDVTDLVGIRVVTYDLDAVKTVSDIIEGEFNVDKSNSVDKSTELRDNEFGYLSVHYVVKLNAKRFRLPEYAQYAELCAEVQIRTVLQHAWSAIDHKLRYKREADVPRELKRRLYRLSGLFELADDEFSRIIREENAIREATASQSPDEFRASAINAITVEEFIRRSKWYEELAKASTKSGISPDYGQSNPDKALSETAYILTALGIRNIGQLEDEVMSIEDPAQTIYNHLYRNCFNFTRKLPPPTIVELAILAKHASEVTIRVLVGGGYDPEFAREIRSSLRSFEPHPRAKDELGEGAS